MAVGKTVDAGVDAAKAALFDFLEVPWLIKKLYAATQTADKIHEIRKFVKHDGREIAVDFDGQIRGVKDWYY
jgi:hypothetical protein